jgi:hypothetical protein
MNLKSLINELAPRQSELAQHPVFSSLQSIDDLRLFMQWHVYAVWDFMSLLKRLQVELTSTRVPWMPNRSNRAARLINEIVLGEETDEAPDGGHLSHFELYLQAMEEIGADTAPIKRFISELQLGASLEQALQTSNTPLPVQEFTLHTLKVARHGSALEVLAYFFFGREQVIPDMFRGLMQQWSLDSAEAPTFVYYLDRHIELDGDTHGPAAQAIIEEMTANSQHAQKQVAQAAGEATSHRLRLWDGLLNEVASKHPRDVSVTG